MTSGQTSFGAGMQDERGRGMLCGASSGDLGAALPLEHRTSAHFQPQEGIAIPFPPTTLWNRLQSPPIFPEPGRLKEAGRLGDEGLPGCLEPEPCLIAVGPASDQLFTFTIDRAAGRPPVLVQQALETAASNNSANSVNGSRRRAIARRATPAELPECVPGGDGAFGARGSR
jgi:hypothetical protein